MGHRQKGKGSKRKRSWHRRGAGPDRAWRRAIKRLEKAACASLLTLCACTAASSHHSEIPCFQASACAGLQKAHPHSEVIYYPRGVRPA